MKKKIFTLLLALVAIAMTAQAQVVLNKTNFPDAKFRAALAETLEISEGDEITAEKIAATTSFNVSRKSIANLTGIEHFTALTELNCRNNRLTTLDVSGCTALTTLDCGINKLTSLDVSKNTALTTLDCGSNKLTALDMLKNTALKYLTCDNNQLTSLDVSKNTALTDLSCYNNRLTTLDVSKNTALTYLSCARNQLTSLDVSMNTELDWLDCYNNQLTSLDVPGCTALTGLICFNNQLTSLDVSKNTELTTLYCYNNQLTSLDVSQNTALTRLHCYNNQLTSLNMSGCTALTYLSCHNNQIKGEEMDVLVASLPTVESGEFIVINTKDANEGNVCTKSQVTIAKGKGWTVYDYNGYPAVKYEGSDDPEQEIGPVDEGDNVDFGSDMDENSDLNGNVIRDIYYNIGDGNGEYDAENGCVVIKKTTDDGVVNDLEGKDIFGEDFKGTFTGIVFKVPAGKGTVKVTAETTGNMLLKVKIGSDEPVEMELEGKLKISFPY
ncbi:MAG: leucine-rich repeat domain-containing protein, partial [Prevotella sp.]|nr:leucine-rich repeat domain-containing protein [Prevotella sp.]